ncbi:MAG: hemolysin family protein [Deltaproteobacteria bacterium]|nr:hemolysin family protein [Deltaproteobacteria bacterium]
MLNPFFSYFILLAVLLFLSAFFSGAETTFFSLSRAQLAKFKKSTHPLSKQLVHFLSRPRDILVTLLFGNEIVNISISIIIAGLVLRFFGPENWEKATTISVVVGTLTILFFGEILPKNVAIHFAPSMAPIMMIFLKPLYWLLRPLRYVLVAFSEWIISRFGGELRKESPLIVEEEFRYLVELGATTGQVAEEERELIHNVFEFGTKTVSQIMTPMTKIFSLPVGMPYNELLIQIKATQYSRIPIHEGAAGNIIGLLYVRDLFAFNRRWEKDQTLSIREILRPPFFVSHKKSLESALEDFRQKKIHMAIATSDSNRPLGIITMHDVLEELFGEVQE